MSAIHWSTELAKIVLQASLYFRLLWYHSILKGSIDNTVKSTHLWLVLVDFHDFQIFPDRTSRAWSVEVGKHMFVRVGRQIHPHVGPTSGDERFKYPLPRENKIGQMPYPRANRDNQILTHACPASPTAGFTLIGALSCKSKNLIYLIQCNKCKCQYIGETKRQLNERFGEHRRSILNDQQLSDPTPVSLHFNQTVHSINDVILIPLELIHSNLDVVRKAREAHLIHKGNTLFPLGINRRDEAHWYMIPPSLLYQ